MSFFARGFKTFYHHELDQFLQDRALDKHFEGWKKTYFMPLHLCRSHIMNTMNMKRTAAQPEDQITAENEIRCARTKTTLR